VPTQSYLLKTNVTLGGLTFMIQTQTISFLIFFIIKTRVFHHVVPILIGGSMITD